MSSSGFIVALSAGFCAASASVAAKFAFSSQEMEELCVILLPYISTAFDVDCSWINPLLRICALLVTLGLNGLMWTLFVKSMQLIGTLKATLTNTSSNLLSTAFLSWLIFDEQHSVRWFCGATLIVTGLLFMQYKDERVSLEESKKSQQINEAGKKRR
ncbi:Transmembrane protein 42 [Holothuria leucospilota]|uniref:Transmembrane protein 42 n=1 Tax=Holothuria leucospilota TaxID=206669 RepID=A0A9Q1HDU2_HOLLE|nr:Transmembrane protein 42 [Holothuria leucospilota]